MNLKKTLLFFLIFASIGIYYYLVEILGTTKTKEIEIEKKRVFSPIKKQDISEVKILKENKTIRLVKESAVWKIKEPVEADVDEDTIAIWLDYVAKLQKERIITEKAEDIKDFGLDTPFLSLQIMTNNSDVFTVQLGDKIQTGSMFYSKLMHEDTVFLIAEYNKNGINKTVHELRDKKIFHFENKNVNGVKVATKAGRTYLVEKKEGKWQIVTPKKLQVDENTIISLLQKIRIAKIKKFVAEKADNLSPYGLENPVAEITLLVGKNKKPYIITLGKENTEEKGVYAKTASKNKIFLLKKEFFEQFPFQVNEIRDRSILQFDDSNVTKIQFVYPEKTITAERNKEKNWEIVHPNKATGDNFNINTLLYDLANSEVLEFVPIKEEKKNTFALDKPRLTVKVFEKDDKEPMFISFGNENQPKEAVYATIGSSGEVLLLKKKLFNMLSVTETYLRNKHLLVVNDEEITGIQISIEGKQYLMTKTDNRWLLNKPEEKKLNTLDVKEVFWSLGEMKFHDIIDDSGQKSLAEFGLENPSIKVNLKDEKESNLETLFIGSKVKDEDFLYAMNDKSRIIYSIALSYKEELINSLTKLTEKN